MRRLMLLLSLSLLAVPGSPPAAGLHRPLLLPDPPSLAGADNLPRPDQLPALARSDAIAFLRACLTRYQREVRGYQAVMQKQERIAGRLGPVETVDVWLREEPYSVLMRWRGESAGRADRALYVAGANDNLVLGRPKNRLARLAVGDVVARPVDDAEARRASRYLMDESGLRHATLRTLRDWQAAQGRGTLYTEYLGTRAVPEAGGATCHILRRTCDPPEGDGVAVVEAAFDTTSWLQVATVLTGPDGQLVAAYYFRDLALNPKFPPDQFERAALTRD